MAPNEYPLNEPMAGQNNSLGPPPAHDDLPPSYDTSRPRSFRAEEYVKDDKKHVLLAASGSIATTKLSEIIKGLENSADISIRIVLTDAATRFFSGASAENPSVDNLALLPHVEGVYTDADEWSEPWVRGNAVLHIELRKWADVMMIAPLDANTLAKMANGLCDNLLTSILRAWDADAKYNPPGREGRSKYLIVAPAMNPAAWMHPATEKQIKILEDEWAEARRFKRNPGHNTTPWASDHSISVVPWAKILKPVVKEPACGDMDLDTMVNVKYIVREILYQVKKFDY